MTTPLVIGAPVWDRAWSLPLWFDSIRANANPADVGLVLVVPPTDDPSRDVIAANADGFRWVEVLRDDNPPVARHDRSGDRHATLAVARNRILSVVERARPERYLSWDTDLLAPPGAVDEVARRGHAVATIWTWLNRQPARTMRWRRDGRRARDVLVQDPACFTAMGAHRRGRLFVPAHYPAAEYAERGRGSWPCAITLGWQLMDRRAYLVAGYEPHPAGEDVTFAYQLARRGVERWCVGGVRGVHLYDRDVDEAAMGYPSVMGLDAQVPLAAVSRANGVERDPEMEALGFFDPQQEMEMTA